MTQLLAEDTVTARKAHRCDDCSITIEPGETYTRQKCLSDGQIDTWKRCTPCAGIARVVFDYWEKFDDDGIGPDDFEEWAREEQAKDPRALAYLVRRGLVTEEPQAVHHDGQEGS